MTVYCDFLLVCEKFSLGKLHVFKSLVRFDAFVLSFTFLFKFCNFFNFKPVLTSLVRLRERDLHLDKVVKISIKKKLRDAIASHLKLLITH